MRLRGQAALARARGDEAMARSLEDIARRQQAQARRLHKQAREAGETKSRIERERQRLINRAKAELANMRKVGLDTSELERRIENMERYAGAGGYMSDAERADREALREAADEGSKEHARVVWGMRADEKARRKEQKIEQAHARIARRARIKKRREDEQAYAERRKIHLSTGHSIVRGQQMWAQTQRRITIELKRIDKQIEADEKARAKAKADKEQAEYEASFFGRMAAARKRAWQKLMSRLSPEYRKRYQEDKEEEQAKKDLAEARKHAGALRRDLKQKREELKAARQAYKNAKTPAERVLAKAELEKKAAAVKDAREKVNANVQKGKDAKAKIEEVADARDKRLKSSLAYKLGAPMRAIRAAKVRAVSAFSNALQNFKEKHGIDKPLLPWQRRTLVQKLLGSDKGYKGKTYQARGSIGGSAVLGVRGQQPTHPDDVKDTEKMPYALHKGKKGGVFYYGPNGQKHYIAHGGVFGVFKSLRAGARGAQLLK